MVAEEGENARLPCVLRRLTLSPPAPRPAQHETKNMNMMYGFTGEVKAKYDTTTMNLFTEVFHALPLALCVDRRALVLHGGLFQQDGVTLEDIARIDRFREPPESGLMSDLLWSDPQPFPGRGPSKRGMGQSFGPDITARFLAANGLDVLIRSHEVKDDGYVVEHGGKCITVFSAVSRVWGVGWGGVGWGGGGASCPLAPSPRSHSCRAPLPIPTPLSSSSPFRTHRSPTTATRWATRAAWCTSLGTARRSSPSSPSTQCRTRPSGPWPTRAG